MLTKNKIVNFLQENGYACKFTTEYTVFEHLNDAKYVLKINAVFDEERNVWRQLNEYYYGDTLTQVVESLAGVYPIADLVEY